MSVMPPAPPPKAHLASPSRSWEEWIDSDGRPRPVADALLRLVEQLGPSGLGERSAQVRQRVRDHGVSYSAPGTGIAGDRPWRLDTFPALLDSDEHAALAKGIAQRAQLLDRVLADLYGPQKLIRAGLLPARLVLGNPRFLRPCHGIDMATHLHLYAADVVRTTSGALCLLRDRTQAPTGAGYALANRLVTSHVLEEVFRLGNTLRLAPFFQVVRAAMAGLARTRSEDARIVLLSSGAFSPTYFEQAFLAQYLGYPLVEGGDLTVRERRVFLKTLGGLSPVDVILRQPEDDYCDPLELRADSQLGVPGLVEAVRVGQVVVANPLGSGLAQTPALLPFLPAIARDFFGEELSLASPPAYWLGDDKSLAHVLAHLDTMVLRPAWSGAGPALAFADGLGDEARQALAAALRTGPERFVAQERVAVAKLPVLVEARVEPRPHVLRGYAAWAGQDYAVMPGGLVLAAAHREELDVSLAREAVAKDLWVRGEGPVGHFSLLPPASHPVELSRGGADLPSRSADNLFWFGRYAERAEALARLARHLLGRLADEGGPCPSSSSALAMLFEVMAAATEAPGLAAPEGQSLAGLALALCSSETTGSLFNTLRASIRSAGAVRDRLSADTFRVLGALGDETERALALAPQPSLAPLMAFLDRVVTSLCALSGLAMESMTRGHGWRFLDMGRRLERALQLLSLLRAAFAKGGENAGASLEALLVVADSSMTYRRRYLAGLHPAAVVDLLLVDDGNPRAVLFQLAALWEHLRQLPHDTSARLRAEERLALGTLTRLQLLDVGSACQAGPEGGPPALNAILRDCESDLSALSEELCGSYLSHAQVPRSLAGTAASG